jgi:hypothetical protein
MAPPGNTPGFLVHRRAQGRHQRMRASMLLAVTQIETIVEIRVVGTLDMLQNRLQPVQPPGQPHFRRGCRVVFISKPRQSGGGRLR